MRLEDIGHYSRDLFEATIGVLRKLQATSPGGRIKSEDFERELKAAYEQVGQGYKQGTAAVSARGPEHSRNALLRGMGLRA